MKLYNADCLIEMKNIPDNHIDLTVTSPPYFNAKKYSFYENINNYLNEMEKIFNLIYNKTKESKICVINVSPIIIPRNKRSEQSKRIPLPFYFVCLMEKIGFEFLEDIIWEKPDGAVPNRNAQFYTNRKPLTYKPNIVTEYILVFKKPSKNLIDIFLKNESLVLGEYERTNIWKINPENKSNHPAPFPEELPDKIIKYYSYENDIVFDPFMGSGTTGKMAILNNRNFIGIEKDPEYFKIAKKRIDEAIADKAGRLF